MLDLRVPGDWDKYDPFDPPNTWIDMGGAQHYRLYSPGWIQCFGESEKFSPGDTVRLIKCDPVMKLREGAILTVSSYHKELSGGRYIWCLQAPSDAKIRSAILTLEHYLERAQS